MAKVTMPQLGESVAEGTIGKWLKQPGDHVDKYEPLLEVITDKVNAEVPSPFEGILKEILVEEGATVPNNAEIAVIETADDGAGTASRPRRPPNAAATTRRAGRRRRAGGADRRAPRQPGRRPRRPRRAATTTADAGQRPPRPPTATAAASAAPAPTAAAAARRSAGDPDARMTPAVRRLLREHGLGAEQIVGTGGGGRITRDDVLAVVEAIAHRSEPPRSRSWRQNAEFGAHGGAPSVGDSPAVRPRPPASGAAPPARAPAAPGRLPATAPTRSSSRRPRCARASPPR